MWVNGTIHREAALATSLDELVQRLVPFVGGCTPDALNSALQRLRKKGHDVPLVTNLLTHTAVDELGEPEWADVKRNRPTPKRFPKARPRVRMDTSTWLPRWSIHTGDNHYPIHCVRGMDGLLNLAIDLKADLLGCHGDFWDFYGLSRFKQEARRARSHSYTIQEEVDSARPFWAEAAKIFDRMFLIPGNHEKRLDTFIDDNHALHGLRALELKTVLELPDKVEVHEFRTAVDIGRLTIEHGDEVRGASTKVGAPNVLREYPEQDTLYGHTHRSQTASKTSWIQGVARKVRAISVGHMSRTECHLYASHPDWQKGFAVLEWYRGDEGEPMFLAHNLHLEENGRFSFGGKLYDGA